MNRNKAIWLTVLMAIAMSFAGMSIYLDGVNVIDCLIITAELAEVAYIWRLYKKGGES